MAIPTVISDAERRLLDRWTLPIMMLDRDLRFIYANEAYLNATHRTMDDLMGEYVFDQFPDTKERVGQVLGQFKKTLDGEITTLDAQPFQLELEDGSIRELVWEATQDPLYDADGNIVGMIQRAEDITRQYELEQRNKAIGYELNHRVKNIMAVVTSIARITGRNAHSVPEFVKGFTARVNAMSRTNDMLAKEEWRGLTIEDIIKDELNPYQEVYGHGFDINGPKIRLSIDATKDVSMVIHELATNAAKYGCLTNPGGKLSISWKKNGDQTEIRWVETCVDKVEKSDNVGFGTRLFDLLPNVQVERDFKATGLEMTIFLSGDTLFV